MARSPRKSPAVGKHGHNSQLADPEDINVAFARQLLMDKEVDDMKERHKRIRKGFEEHGVSLGQIDKWKKKIGSPISEIENQFREDFHYAGVAFPDLGEQFDLLKPKAEAPERRAAHYHAGRMAALKGEENAPPPNLSGDDLQRWQAGYNDHLKHRKTAEKEHADFMAKALKTAAQGGVVDGTGKGKKADQVRAKSAADFAKDNPGVVLGEAPGSGATPPTNPDANLPDEEFDTTPRAAPAADGDDEGEGEDGADGADGDEGGLDPIPPSPPAGEDPLVVDGKRFPNLTRANQYRQAQAAKAAKAAKPKSQSQQAAEARAAAKIH